jgi:hypothetical protein
VQRGDPGILVSPSPAPFIGLSGASGAVAAVAAAGAWTTARMFRKNSPASTLLPSFELLPAGADIRDALAPGDGGALQQLGAAVAAALAAAAGAAVAVPCMLRLRNPTDHAMRVAFDVRLAVDGANDSTGAGACAAWLLPGLVGVVPAAAGGVGRGSESGGPPAGDGTANLPVPVVRLRGFDELSMAGDVSADEEDGAESEAGLRAGGGDWQAAARAAEGRVAAKYPDTPAFIVRRRNNSALLRATITVSQARASDPDVVPAVALVRIAATVAIAPAALVDRAGSLGPAAQAADAQLRVCATFALPLSRM